MPGYDLSLPEVSGLLTGLTEGGLSVNWDAIGALAESLGAIAVIVSIVYLAAQVRQTRLQLEAQAEDNITSRAFEAYNPVYEGNHAAVFRKGLESPETLTDDEAFLFRLMMDRQRGVFATIVRRSLKGSISKELSQRLLMGYRQLFCHSKGGRQWLENSRRLMSKAELKALEDDTFFDPD